MNQIMRRTALSAAVVVAVGVLAAGDASAANLAPSKSGGRAGSSGIVNPTIAKVAPATPLPNGASLAGALSQTEPVHIEVALKLRNREQLDGFLQSQRAAAFSSSASVLSSDQFTAQYSPTQKQAQEVADFLTRSGFTNVSIAGNRLLVSADTTADLAQAAFHTTLSRVTTADGRDAFANTDAVNIPVALQDSVLAVLGLQTVYQGHTMNAAAPDAVTGHNPLEWSSIYGATGVATAAGVTAGIITQGKITQSITDLNTFTSQNGLATVTTQTVTVGSTSTDASGVAEWDIDSQDIVGMSGGQIGKLVFYNIPTLSTANLVAGFNKGVVDNVAKIINVSIGGCETGAMDGSAAAGDQVFAQAVAQGQTFSISTGDSGADECGDGGTTPSWPANSQYVMAISGTTLNASTTTWSSEVVWNTLSSGNGATGGSQSTYEPKPSWQTLWSGPRRGVADVAFEGDPNSGAKIVLNGGSAQYGGTSLAAPIFAGMWARVIAVKGTGVGFAGPLIYQLPAGDFHDVTSGNNNGSTAGPGYDLATGRGSVILSSAINHIGGGSGGNVPPVANFSFTTSGLTANFTDSSTDSDGTISSRAWNFGDGATSTATNPSHAYAAGGTYNVGLTVTDNGGASNTKTQSVTVSSGGGGGTPTQILANTGFESGTTPWTGTTADICTTSCGSESPNGGTHFVWLDGYGTTHTETIAQQIAIPAGKTAATLQYYLHIDTAETTTSTAYDTLKVQVLNTSGTVLATLATYSNLNKNTGYTVHTNSLAPYIGQTVVIKFTGAEDSSLQTSFVIDDVTLTVQ
jgi:subtilase family serine protease